MTIKLNIFGGSDWVDGEVLYADDLNDTIKNVDGSLGEVKQFALSLSGATTKANLQTRGWAICDGTDIVTTQGITSADITGNAPDLQDKFIRMSNDETSGTTGGSASSSHTHTQTMRSNGGGTGTNYNINQIAGISAAGPDESIRNWTTGNSSVSENRPPFYELAFFIKVKI